MGAAPSCSPPSPSARRDSRAAKAPGGAIWAARSALWQREPADLDRPVVVPRRNRATGVQAPVGIPAKWPRDDVAALGL